jgi:hypothetical protein
VTAVPYPGFPSNCYSDPNLQKLSNAPVVCGKHFCGRFPSVLACTMHEGMVFHGHAYKFGDVRA